MFFVSIGLPVPRSSGSGGSAICMLERNGPSVQSKNYQEKNRTLKPSRLEPFRSLKDSNLEGFSTLKASNLVVGF